MLVLCEPVYVFQVALSPYTEYRYKSITLVIYGVHALDPSLFVGWQRL